MIWNGEVECMVRNDRVLEGNGDLWSDLEQCGMKFVDVGVE